MSEETTIQAQPLASLDPSPLVCVRVQRNRRICWDMYSAGIPKS
jgi:hypothetical protein